MSNPSGHILVVDDDPATRDLLRRRLEASGYRVQLAENGLEALERIERDPPELVIVDMMMPLLDGIGVIRRLRVSREHAAIPVLMLTARDRTVDKQFGLETGADDYLGKPFEFQELLARVQALLRRSRGWAVTEDEVRRGYVVAVIGGKGGVGTTTIAANLAVALAHAGTATVLADLTTLHSSAAAMLHLPPRRRIDRLPLNLAGVLTVPMIESTLLSHPSGMRLLAGRTAGSAASVAEGAADLVEGLRRVATVTVADLDALPDPIANAALRVATQVWVVVQPEVVSVAAAAALVAQLEEREVPPHRVGLLVNQTSPAMVLPASVITGQVGLPVLLALTFAGNACYEATRRGVPVIDLAPALPFSQAIHALAATIAERPFAQPPSEILWLPNRSAALV